MKTKIIILVFILFFSCLSPNESNAAKINYRQKMRNFVILISKVAKKENKKFYIIPQNALEIVVAQGRLSKGYLAAIDGVGCEELLYGNSRDGVRTSRQTSRYFLKYLKEYHKAGKKVLVIDYVKSKRQAQLSYQYAKQNDFIAFPAERKLIKISNWKFNHHINEVNELKAAQNFLFQLTVPSHHTKRKFLQLVRNTNYDLLIIDAFFFGDILTKHDLADLQKKKSGKKRLVIAYLSIGEAETYRYYWKSEWKRKRPPFLEKENPQWKENYKVKYWMDGWQKIICGDKTGKGFETSYLKKILDAGFDGVYLDIVDAAFYFEKKGL